MVMVSEIFSNDRRRRGAIVRGWLVALGMIAAVGVLVLLLWLQGRAGAQARGEGSDTLLVYCAAGIKPVAEEAARDYLKEFHTTVQLQYGGSGTLLADMQVARVGDLFIAADASYIRIAREKGLVSQTVALAKQRPVIVVHKGNPKAVKGLADLQRPDVSVAMANPEAASVGRVAQKLLEKTGQWKELKQHVRVFKPTVNDVANDVKIDSVDAAIVWDSTGRQYPELELVHVPVLEAGVETVTIGVLVYAKHPERALAFANYLAQADRGQKLFAKYGYETVAGGAASRPATESTH